LKEKKANLINYINYKDVIIIFSFWYLILFFTSMTRNISFSVPILTSIFHFLFFISGRFIFIGITVFYLSSLYPVSFSELGLVSRNKKKSFFNGLSIGLVLMLMVLFLINIPLSFSPEGYFSPLFFIKIPEDFIASLIPLILLFFGFLIIALGEQLLLSAIVFELFRNTLFTRLISLILSSLFYSVILLTFQPERILINLIVAFIALRLYLKNRSIISSAIFTASYYSLYITYIFGWEYLKY